MSRADLKVTVVNMRESNGRVTYFAFIHPEFTNVDPTEHYSFASSRSRGRLQYEADCMTATLEGKPLPCSTEYDDSFPPEIPE